MSDRASKEFILDSSLASIAAKSAAPRNWCQACFKVQFIGSEEVMGVNVSKFKAAAGDRFGGTLSSVSVLVRI